MLDYDQLLGKVRNRLAKVNKSFDNLLENMNKLIIDGITHEVEGNNVSIVKKSVRVNGKVIVDNIESDTIHIKWEGDVANLDCTSCDITGNVTGNVEATRVTCGNVGGDVECTSIQCDDVQGNVDATSVKCGNVGGSVDGVSVKHRKS